jgi:F-type H+-transporting ATPase subunit delta
VKHAASREALARLRDRLEPVTARFSTGEGLSELAQDLYGVTGVLVHQPRLRRALADPSTPADGRAELASRVFDGKIGASAMQLVRDAVGLRWSSPWDLLDALETMADEVLFGAAEQDGVLDDVEDEAESSLTTALDDVSVDIERRLGLLRDVLADKVRPTTRMLLEHAVASQRKHNVNVGIDNLLELSASRRHRSIARVISAVPLNRAQQTRLTARLTEMYGRPINIRTAIDPSVRGGLIIRVGDEVIDGSIAGRLADARKALAG